ncbi:MAG: MOSC domain-containing protein [Firmicutes bacterium]|jgi:MOSC domain-containing protein YiiM|nr:MOSC domain-containing protein [Bacillota bacterium]
MEGRIVAVCRSDEKGTRKRDIGSGVLVEGFGLEGDAHGGGWHRQVSLLSLDGIEEMRRLGLDVGPGDFAENLTVEGLDLSSLPVGTRLRVGEAVIEVTQIGKDCHVGCDIFRKVGRCIMPREGIFAKVVAGGRVNNGDPVVVVGENGLPGKVEPR